MKDMLYRERLKAIQDDMLPFGYVESINYDNKDQGVKGDDGNIWFESEWKGRNI